MPDQPHSSTPPGKVSSPAEALLRIVHGDVDDVHIPHKSIVIAKKVKNSIMRAFVREFQKKGKLTDTKMIDVILAFDEVVEKELLTEEILEKIRRDPSILQKFIKK